MYAADSFFDLSLWQRIGLVGISTMLFLLTHVAAWMLLRKRTLPLRIAGALILFWLFVWMSPQAYYQYYRLIIEDLPQQWVIWPPNGPERALAFLLFSGPSSLSAHSQGLLGWSLIAAALANLPWRERRGVD